MVADFSKLLSHPDKDEIISKLITGIKPKDVADWLKLKYPEKEQRHLQLSSKMLKDFVDNNLDLYNTLQNDIAGTKNGQTPPKEISESLQNNKTYKERLNELADNEIDIKRIMVETVFIIKQRIEQVFDKVQENPQNMKPDHALIKWFEVLLNAAEKFQKIVNEAPDLVVQHNHSVQMVEQHTAFLQDAIRETMAEVDPKMAFLFMEKMNDKMNSLQEPQPQTVSPEKRLAEAQVINTKVNKIDGED